VRLVSTDFTATTGTTVVLNNACTSGDSVVTESFLVSSVLNAIPNTAGSVSSSNIVSGVTLTSPIISSITNTGTLTLPTTTGTLALQSDGIGFSQTWQNVAGSRALGTTYTNSTGKPIAVSAQVQATSNGTSTMVISGVTAVSTVAQANLGVALFGIVPPSATYVVDNNQASKSIVVWAELR
jgi:hypothetical protein